MSSAHPSLFALDEFFAEELDAARRTEVERHAADCPSCRGYLRQLESDRSEILERLPARDLGLRAQLARVEPGAGLLLRRWRTPVLASVVAAAAGFVIVLWNPWSEEQHRPVDSVRFMGGANSSVHPTVWRGGTRVAAEPLRARDELRFELLSDEKAPRYIAMFLSEGTGVTPVGRVELAPVGSHWLLGSLVVEAGAPTRVLIVAREGLFDESEIAAMLDRETERASNLEGSLGVVYDRLLGEGRVP